MTVARAVCAAMLCVPAGATASERASIAIAPGGDAEIEAAADLPLVHADAFELTAGLRADAYLVRLDGLGDPEPTAILRPALAANAAWQPTSWLAFDAAIALGRTRPQLVRECNVTLSRDATSAAVRFRDSVDRIDLSGAHAIGGTTIGVSIENLFDIAPRDVTELKPDPPLTLLVTLGRAL